MTPGESVFHLCVCVFLSLLSLSTKTTTTTSTNNNNSYLSISFSLSIVFIHFRVVFCPSFSLYFLVSLISLHPCPNTPTPFLPHPLLQFQSCNLMQTLLLFDPPPRLVYLLILFCLLFLSGFCLILCSGVLWVVSCFCLISAESCVGCVLVL